MKKLLMYGHIKAATKRSSSCSGIFSLSVCGVNSQL